MQLGKIQAGSLLARLLAAKGTSPKKQKPHCQDPEWGSLKNQSVVFFPVEIHREILSLRGSSALLAGFMASMAAAPHGQQMLSSARRSPGPEERNAGPPGAKEQNWGSPPKDLPHMLKQGVFYVIGPCQTLANPSKKGAYLLVASCCLFGVGWLAKQQLFRASLSKPRHFDLEPSGLWGPGRHKLVRCLSKLGPKLCLMDNSEGCILCIGTGHRPLCVEILLAR